MSEEETDLLITLPNSVLNKLERIAERERYKRKNLIEKVLIDYANNVKP